MTRTWTACPWWCRAAASKLIGGTLRSELTREEVTTHCSGGFLPPGGRVRRGRQPGPHGFDPAGSALCTGRGHDPASGRLPGPSGRGHQRSGGFRPTEGASFLHPTAVLFNGGVFNRPALVERMHAGAERLAGGGAGTRRHGCSKAADLDLAVARGAAYYGYVRGGEGVRIRGGTAQAYYVGVESAMPAVPGYGAAHRMPCASRPSAWRKAARRNCRPRSSVWWSASRCASDFSALRCAAKTRWAPCWSIGTQEEIQELEGIEADASRRGTAPRARWCR